MALRLSIVLCVGEAPCAACQPLISCTACAHCRASVSLSGEHVRLVHGGVGVRAGVLLGSGVGIWSRGSRRVGVVRSMMVGGVVRSMTTGGVVRSVASGGGGGGGDADGLASGMSVSGFGSGEMVPYGRGARVSIAPPTSR